MVQMALYEIVRMVAVPDRFVPAARSMDVVRCMGAALVVGCTAVLIGRAGRKRVLVHMIAVDMVQVAVMKIIDMPVVTDRGVSAVRAMDMRVPLLFHASFSH
jgi:hypothetical protein